jgi:MFS transporter, OPA family, glycerol-3-phosphate transporter
MRRFKNFINLWTSYATYYFGKVNLSLIIPVIIATYGLSKGQLGAVASAFLFAYATGQFIHGHFSERFNPFTYMGVGLILSAIMNTFLGFSSGVFFLLFFGEMMDGFFQSMGWSSCVRANSLLYKSENLSTILGTSYQIGNSVAWLITGYIIHYLGWQWGFWFAAIVMALRGITLQINKPEIPRSDRNTIDQIKATLTKEVILSGISLGILNFVRYGVIVWIPTFLYQVHHMPIDKVGLNIFIIPIAGCLGTLTYNASARYIKRETLTIIYMAILTGLIYMFSFSIGWAITFMLAASGFFLYGPHVFLVTTLPGRHYEGRTVASSTGFIDGVGYIGAMLTGVIMPSVIEYGWNIAFNLWAASCLGIIGIMIILMRGQKS